MFKIIRFLRSSKCLETSVESTFTTQKAKACSPWTACCSCSVPLFDTSSRDNYNIDY